MRYDMEEIGVEFFLASEMQIDFRGVETGDLLFYGRLFSTAVADMILVEMRFLSLAQLRFRWFPWSLRASKERSPVTVHRRSLQCCHVLHDLVGEKSEMFSEYSALG
ncbi:hypothetical protein Ancab_017180 [Ancistrocladus abbreviatus]